jgi:hypothetical protein
LYPSYSLINQANPLEVQPAGSGMLLLHHRQLQPASVRSLELSWKGREPTARLTRGTAIDTFTSSYDQLKGSVSCDDADKGGRVNNAFLFMIEMFQKGLSIDNK